MAQAISLAILVVALFLLQAPKAAEMASPEGWGEAVGRLLFGPILIYFVLLAVLYYGIKLIRGHMGHSFTTTRLNYVALVITILSVLGRIAQEAGRLPS